MTPPPPPKCGGVRAISQGAFDDLVRENVEDLGMDHAEALQDAIDTLTLQGVDLTGAFSWRSPRVFIWSAFEICRPSPSIDFPVLPGSPRICVSISLILFMRCGDWIVFQGL